jgi:hypothetical protein
MLLDPEPYVTVIEHSNLILFDLRNVPGATQALVELLAKGASQRMFHKFIESS